MTTAGSIRLGALERISGFRIRLAEQLTMRSFAAAFAGTGLSAALVTALELIHCNDGIRPAELATAMMVESSNMAVLLRRLEQQGWVDARPGRDRRSKTLHLKAAGRAALADIHRRLTRQDRLLSDGLSQAERDMLHRLLDRLLEHGRERQQQMPMRRSR